MLFNLQNHLQYMVQCKMFKKGNAIIVGRGVNSILKEYNPMNIFVYANMESKINRCKQKADTEENLTDKELEKKIKTYVLWQIEKNMNMLKYNMEDDKKSL